MPDVEHHASKEQYWGLVRCGAHEILGRPEADVDALEEKVSALPEAAQTGVVAQIKTGSESPS